MSNAEQQPEDGEPERRQQNTSGGQQTGLEALTTALSSSVERAFTNVLDTFITNLDTRLLAPTDNTQGQQRTASPQQEGGSSGTAITTTTTTTTQAGITSTSTANATGEFVKGDIIRFAALQLEQGSRLALPVVAWGDGDEY